MPPLAVGLNPQVFVLAADGHVMHVSAGSAGGANDYAVPEAPSD